MFWDILFCLVVLVCISDGKNIGKKTNYLNGDDYALARNIPKKSIKASFKMMQSRKLFQGDIDGINSNNVEAVSNNFNKYKKNLKAKPDGWIKEKNKKRGRGKKRVTRSAETTTRLWPKVGDYVRVPYEISTEYTDHERAIIAGAIADIEKNTCIRIVPKQATDNNYIKIGNRGGKRCSSYFGMIGGMQTVNLGTVDGTCVSHGTTQHELMHAFGFFHEQSRKDRDKFVTILWDNIKPEKKFNFNQYDDQVALGTEYDYKSIMHYPLTLFGINGKPTIVAKGERGGGIGTSVRFTDTDIIEINRLYECPCEDQNVLNCHDDDFYLYE